jgi:hypothetical protein
MPLEITPVPIKSENVVINLQPEHVPVVEKPAKSPPCMGIYKLIPSQQPKLAEMIEEVVWQIKSKELAITIKETANLDVYLWMEYMHDQQKRLQEGPFVDMNEGAVTLRMFDSQSREVARMKFKNVSLKDHACVFGDKKTENLSHNLLIGYQECERVDLQTTVTASDESMDGEWQSVEV